MSKSSPHSNYWLTPREAQRENPNHTLKLIEAIRLTEYRRSIADFVHIITGGDPGIRVEFTNGTEAQTDGATVTIGMPPDGQRNCDFLVGVALHEGSHCAYSPCITWKRLIAFGSDSHFGRSIIDQVNGKSHTPFSPKIEASMAANEYARKLFFFIVNILEDMRIDRLVYSLAPGYRPYYMEIYDTIIFSEDNDEALKNGKFRNTTARNYTRMLMSLPNDNLNPADLPDFNKIIEIVDLDNIDRIFDLPIGPWHYYAASDSWENGSLDPLVESWKQVDPVWTKATQIMEIILDHCTDLTFDDPISRSGQGVKSANSRRLDDYYRGRVKWLNGESEKTKVPSDLERYSKIVYDAEIELQIVGGDDMIPPKIPVMVIRNVTKTNMWHGIPFFERVSGVGRDLSEGKRMGAVLAQKLQFRSEPDVIRFNRQDRGSIDKRMLHQLGADNYNVFTKTRTDSFTPVLIHLTLDASGSMEGHAWRNAINLATAMAVLADKNPMIEVIVSVRGTGVAGTDFTACIAVIHDSRKRQFVESEEVFAHISPSGYTPEALCFAATLDLLLEETNSDTYFINVSDGMPDFTVPTANNGRFSYGKVSAIPHTQLMVRRMQEAGVRVMSYFVGNVIDGKTEDTFRLMYKDTARFIDIQSMPDILRTLESFLSDRNDMKRSFG